MSERSFLTIDDVPLAGKRVFARLDLNCPVDEKTKKPQLSPRIHAHARTVLELSSANAKVVLLAHQGRKGDDDFISLAAHVPLLQSQVDELARMLQKKAPQIRFVDDVCGEKAKSAIKSLQMGDVLLLQNVRYLDDETTFEKTGKSELVHQLSPYCEIFVLDAFSCSHRAHASVVGFKSVPNLAGSVMAQELGALTQFDSPAHPLLFVMGGAKPDDSLPILKDWLTSGKLDYALTGGSMANLMLLASGRDIGEPSKKFLESKGVLESLPQAKELYAKFSSKILLPDDVVVSVDGNAQVLASRQLPSPNAILDIGPVTSARYGELLRSAGSIVMNGPMGVYEKEAFSSGTRSVLEAISQSSGFSLLGGGHTLSALDKFSIDRTKLGYVSLSGKALIEYLSGTQLPGVEVLRFWALKIEEGEKPQNGIAKMVGAKKPKTPQAKKPVHVKKPLQTKKPKTKSTSRKTSQKRKKPAKKPSSTKKSTRRRS